MPTELNNTAHKILDVAERYTQLKGFNAFSYKDLQNEVGVKTSSIHYYFPTKQELALSMTERYIEQFRSILNSISQEHESGINRLEALGNVYVNVVSEGKFCMCGMLASDMMSLPDIVNDKLCEFFDLLEEWIIEAIELSKNQGKTTRTTDSKTTAAHFLASLEGGMLIARARRSPAHLESILKDSLAQL